MKSTNLTTAVKKAGLVLLTITLLATATNAQENKYENKAITETAIANLICGIKNENEGVKRDCIYYAAVYKIYETIDALKEQLDDEENSSTRALIALALNKLGEDPGSEALSKYVSVDWNTRLKDTAAAFTTTNDYQAKVKAPANKK